MVCLRASKGSGPFRICWYRNGSTIMLKRLLWVTSLLLLFALPVQAAGLAPEFLVRVNLEQPSDFERAAATDLKPVFRWGNEFYFVASAITLGTLDQLHIEYRVIETGPFKAGGYYIGAESPSTERLGISKLEAQALDQIAGATLWKVDRPLAAEALTGGEGPLEITGEAIPFTYMTQLVSLSQMAFTDPDLDSIVARISQDSVVAIGTHLQDFQTRYVYTSQNDAAQAYITAKFLSYGYTDVQADNFSVFGWPGHNVICTKTGVSDPDKVIVIGAHYDSWNSQSDPYVFAPGADDNGSGTVGVLEIARAVASIPTRKTIIFIAFDAEEVGLVGSEYYAGQAAANGMDIELMLNMDMIGYNPNAYPEVLFATNPASVAYANLSAQLTSQYTALWPYVSTSAGGSSDHAPFGQNGFDFVYAQEYDFNTPGWHTNIDSISRMNIPYWTDVVRTVGLTAYAVSEAPSPVPSMTLWDAGDGSTLEARWQPLIDPDITGYHLYYGTAPGNYPYMIDVPGAGSSSRQLTGLTEGQTYYVAVAGVNTAGWESIGMSEVSLQPLSLPRVPGAFSADPEYQRIDLNWDLPVELDLNHYEVYRGLDTFSIALYDGSVTSSPYSDAAVAATTRYFYQIRAIDNAANTSAMSGIVSAIPATFDQGTLLFDLTSQTISDPTQEQQEDVYNGMFAGFPHGFYRYDNYADPVDKSELGQYGTVYWIDDDLSWEKWTADQWAKLEWYLSYGNNVVIIGWATPNEVSSGTFLYDRFRVSDIERINAVDCVGGIGEGGFPSVIFDTAKVVDIFTPWNGKLAQIWTETTADVSAEVILRYNSAINDPAREVLPVAVRRDYGGNKMALVGLPLYYMRLADAQAMITSFAAWFGLPPADPGDLNADGNVDALDIMYEVDIVFAGLFPPTGYAHADVNGDCVCNVLDIVYLIDYVFRGGAAPVVGCVR